jgi:transposase
MVNRTFLLEITSLDLDLWQKLYYKHQQEYIRKKLLAIKYLYSGQSRAEVAQILNCTYKTLSRWVDKFFNGGLDELVKPIKHHVTERLSQQQKQDLKTIILTSKPIDYGIDRNMWTGKIIALVLRSEMEVELKESRIYEILDELNLSYQKAHRDYANADEEQQNIFVLNLKKNLKIKTKKKK